MASKPIPESARTGAATKENPLRLAEAQGQAVWLDYIRRSILTGGDLKRVVEEAGLSGVASNPTIFEKAIAGSTDYDEQLRALLTGNSGLDDESLFETIAVKDIQSATDILRPVYDRTKGADGFVSLEVSPKLARDTAGTIRAAQRLWKAVGRPNLMIKVPATPEGIPAVEELLASGINVNITLMFSMAHYEAVANAYIRGLRRAENPAGIASVASFFVSRVDNLTDPALQKIGTPEALALEGKIGIANCRVFYQRFLQIFGGSDFAPLKAKGARVQRVLWASTSTKNPKYPDTLYVAELIGKDTVDTIPPATMDAFRDHGEVRVAQEGGRRSQRHHRAVAARGRGLVCEIFRRPDGGAIEEAGCVGRLTGRCRNAIARLACRRRESTARRLDQVPIQPPHVGQRSHSVGR